MDVPGNLRYTPDHVWILVANDEGTIGITDFAQDHLGEVVYIELPARGETLTRGQPFGVVESVKSVSDLSAPVSGEVIARNEQLIADPTLANEDPYGDGWMLQVRLSDLSEIDSLLDSREYLEN